MKNLSLLFTKDGLQWQIKEDNNIIDEEARFVTDDTPSNFISTELDNVLNKYNWENIEVFSALNRFSITPNNFTQHELGKKLISYNTDISNDNEEVMSVINNEYELQFYYSFPKIFYNKIKSLNTLSNFYFSGNKFLNSINSNTDRKEIHINLYLHQMEFFALKENKVILYNNLDVTSDVDFLYFIMFSLSKIDFSVSETDFYIYGEITDNDTFISELEKFAPNINIVSENFKGKHIILN